MCDVCQDLVDPKETKLAELLAGYAGQKGALIPVLQKAQEIYGYLPADVLRRVGRGLKIPVARVYGVATFYAQFRLTPMGRNVLRVCLGTACHVRGGAKVLETIEQELGVKDGGTTEDQRFTLEIVACIGACGLAPTMMINDQVHGRLTPDKVGGILAQYE
ncbi:NADH-quinone oxidoreductase subunit E-like [Acididesulfobacillus acetoxydans]|uniref:NADH-quinone oxidoreductase subunit E-like n=1 Tax=Acididesulfobacillus acetoxydans TaxID=1561005 RepID=A0A8S0WX46_9FIRM|nr:NADH-quinone oxidoreductase subunit NuoE [Acididesulfobacillus acetoxydans]CAA7600721.1 NADH-quinone oxidoreductase subunit E-like [Acididesulfobacillus acetoxydans]CEJ06170.1 Proton-translocating NADH-ubiquinone oxidoreductase, chain e [Acididesulfobacillus acetoxydans]